MYRCAVTVTAAAVACRLQYIQSRLRFVLDSNICSAALRMLQHLGLQIWGPAIGGSGKFLCAVIGL